MGQLVGNYNAHMRVRAARSVRAYAATEFDLPPAKVITEFLELLNGRLAVLLDGSFGAAPGHKLLVVLNDLGSSDENGELFHG